MRLGLRLEPAQTVPKAHSLVVDPGPPSSHFPLLRRWQVLPHVGHSPGPRGRGGGDGGGGDGSGGSGEGGGEGGGGEAGGGGGGNGLPASPVLYRNVTSCAT